MPCIAAHVAVGAAASRRRNCRCSTAMGPFVMQPQAACGNGCSSRSSSSSSSRSSSAGTSSRSSSGGSSSRSSSGGGGGGGSSSRSSGGGGSSSSGSSFCHSSRHGSRSSRWRQHAAASVAALCMVALASPAVLQAVRAAEPSSSAPAAALARGGGAAPRAAICFFGLMRSVEFTKDSIRNNIFDELTRHGWAYDVLLHTYHMHHYHNPRSREANVSLDVDAWRLLHPARHILEPPEANAAAIEAEVLAYLKHGDPWGEDEPHRSMHNVLMQLHSIERVTQLWEDDGTYDVVLYLRPDQWYFNRLNMSHVEAARSQRDAVYVPFYAWEAGGINDRVALGHPAAMKVYGNRKRGLAAYVAQGNNDMHAERYARRALEAAGIRVLKTNLHAERVRANGVLWGAPRRGRDGGLDGFPPLNTRAHYRMVRDPLLGSSWRALRCNATLKC